MNNYCAFSKDYKCIKWIDYEITHQSLRKWMKYATTIGLKLKRKINISTPCRLSWKPIIYHILKKCRTTE